MFAIGNEEIDAAPVLGETVSCWICGKEHHISYGDIVNKDGTKTPSKLIAFFKCGKQTYLAGIDGKELRPK
jgi:hypothetical protein